MERQQFSSSTIPAQKKQAEKEVQYVFFESLKNPESLNQRGKGWKLGV